MRADAPLERRLVALALERDDRLLYHNEPIWRDGVLVGKTSSGMFGHTVGAPLALGYLAAGGEAVTEAWIAAGHYEIEVAAERIAGTRVTAAVLRSHGRPSEGVKRHARVVVIGGGAVGCSALYHLARLGWTDVLLLERDELTAGSTWHAAGNCPNFATSWSLLKLQSYSTALYARLARTVGYDINYHITGSIRLAHTADRVDEFRHVRSQARAQGLEFELLSPQEIRQRHPFIEIDGIRAGLWDPTDGDIDPAQLTQAFAKGARDLGAHIQRGTPVTALQALPDGGWRIETPAGAIEAEYVINAAGYRGGEVAAMIGEYLPLVSLSHQYLVTEDIAALAARGASRLPLLRDPDVSYYLRQERHGLLLGPYEDCARAHWLEGLPAEFAHQLFADDLGRIERYIEAACARVPLLGSVGVRRVINGPIPYAPDGNPLIGPAAGVRNFFHCCAFTFGIVQAGGAGRVIAEWVVNGEPDWDMWSVDCRRYGAFADRRYALSKALETYSMNTASPIRRRSAPPAAPRGSRRCTGGCRRPARCSERAAAGSARCTTHGPAIHPARKSRSAAPTGTVPWPRVRGRRLGRGAPRHAGLRPLRGRGRGRSGVARPAYRRRAAAAGTYRPWLLLLRRAAASSPR